MANKIICPKCGEEINIENLIQAGAKETLNKELALQKEIFENKLKEQKQEQEQIKKAALVALEEEIEKKLIEQKEKFKANEEKIKKDIIEEQKEAQNLLEKELEEKTNKLKELNILKAQNLKLEREKASLKEEIEIEFQKKLNENLEKEKSEYIRNIETKHEQDIAQWKKKFEDQIKLTEEMKKKQTQGSMQLQGEIQELSIESWLKDNFKFDEIEEILKGANGADCIQYVEKLRGRTLGVIYYESKNTQNFSNDWIAKLKNDMKIKNADIGVIVTSVYPKDMDRMGIKDGIYICNMFEFKGLSAILRNEIIKLNQHKLSQENKQDKKEMLYNYLTSNEFEMQVRGIIDGFTTMRNDLEKEKTAMMKYWQHREKQLNLVLENTSLMCGSIKSISGNTIQSTDPLDELPGNDEILVIEDKSKRRKKN